MKSENEVPMDLRIIFSRKGFDSGIGKVASPILPSGELCSLPIPEGMPTRQSKRYAEIWHGDLSLGDLVSDLTRGAISPQKYAHLDPDLRSSALARLPGWRPLFGQTGAAERHLQNQGVQAGDVFLFYGWFREVGHDSSGYRYVKYAPDLHVVFGWLQVEQRIPVTLREGIPPWAVGHPHNKIRTYRPLDSLYISPEQMSLPGQATPFPGAGVFPRFDTRLCLTAPGHTRSVWQLPRWLYPDAGRGGISYHAAESLWKRVDGHVLLNTCGRGQEFVLDCAEYPEALDWLAELLSVRNDVSRP